MTYRAPATGRSSGISAAVPRPRCRAHPPSRVSPFAARRDPVESLACATITSLVTFPVTWFHYPVALIPFAAVALARADEAASPGRVRRLLAVAVVFAPLTIGAPVLLWVAVALVPVAVWGSGRRLTNYSR